MKSLLIIILLLFAGDTFACSIRTEVNIWTDVHGEAKDVMEYRKQGGDTWLIYSEIDPKDVDCDGITTWIIGRAVELGADPCLAWHAIFEYTENGILKCHMAVMIEGLWCVPVIMPSSGLWTIEPFLSVPEYEKETKMKLIESFQIKLEETD